MCDEEGKAFNMRGVEETQVGQLKEIEREKLNKRERKSIPTCGNTRIGRRDFLIHTSIAIPFDVTSHQPLLSSSSSSSDGITECDKFVYN